MFVILDTTEFFDAPYASTNLYKVLQEYLDRTHSHLVVPQVVFREVMNHARKSLDDVERALKNAERGYARLSGTGADALAITRPDFAETLQRYEATLRGILEQSFGAIFLPLPDASHGDVLERALLQKKPFTKGKEGYRDTLIWLSVVRRIRETPGVYVFVTGNIKDFKEPELKIELGNLPDGSSLDFEADLTSFIERYAKPELQRIDNLANMLRTSLALPGLNIRDELSELNPEVLRAMAQQLRIRHHSFRDIEGPYYIESHELLEDIVVQEVYRTQDEMMVECSTSYDLTIEGYMFKSSAYGLDAEDPIYVTDWDWNEQYAAVEFHGSVDAQFLIRLSEKDEGAEGGEQYSVESIEVTAADLNDDEY